MLNRVVTGVMASAITLVAFGCEPEVLPTSPDIMDDVCYEDMPCWDCETMGNLQCGPDVTLIPPLVITREDLPATG